MTVVRALVSAFHPKQTFLQKRPDGGKPTGPLVWVDWPFQQFACPLHRLLGLLTDLLDLFSNFLGRTTHAHGR